MSAGIMVLTRGVFSGALPPMGLLAALACAVMVAGYSLVDGVGVRLADNTLAYVGWLFLLELPVAAFIFSTRMERLRAVPPRVLMLGFWGGMFSGTAYGMVLYAKTFAPLGIVSAMRGTSEIFAAMIGVLWFGAGPKGNRLVAAVIVAAGIIVIGMGS